MATTLGKTEAAAALKEFYSDRQVLLRDAYEDNPFLALIPKFEDWQGKNYRLPIRYGTPQGIGVSIAQAQSSLSTGLYEDFQLTHVSYYGVARVDGFTIRASRGDIGAFVNLMSEEIDGVMHSVGRRLATQLPRNFGGAMGQVGSTTTTVLTLKDPETVVNFEVGMVVDSDDTDGTSGSADGGLKVISAIDRDAGTLTTSSGNWTSASNFADDDYIFIKGDFGNCISGLDSWAPSSAPGTALFFGVDRSVDPTRLGGLRFDGSSLPIHEAIARGLTRSRREGYKCTHVFLNHDHFTDLEIALGDRAYLDTVRSPDGMFGFDSLKYRSPAGTVQIVPDHNFPPGIARAVDMNELGLYSLGPAPGILDHDDVGEILRVSNDDSVEVRVGYYAQLGCALPGSINRIALATG